MGRDLAAASPAARAVFAEVDDALSENLSDLIWNGQADQLQLTRNAQPALMATSIAALRALEAEGAGITSVAFVAGHSLGEYSALCAAGALSLADTARLLRLRGQAMQAAVPLGVGAMAALLGLDFAAAATSSGEPMARVVMPGEMRLTMPDRALPAPISQVSVTPCAAIQSTDSRQRTEPVTCSTRRARITSGSLTASARTFATSGTRGGSRVTRASAVAMASAAGCIRAQWKGALTGSSRARFAPLALAISSARSTAPRCPETTTWAGSLSFAA